MKHLKSLFLLDEVKNQFLRTILRVWLSTLIVMFIIGEGLIIYHLISNVF